MWKTHTRELMPSTGADTGRFLHSKYWNPGRLARLFVLKIGCQVCIKINLILKIYVCLAAVRYIFCGRKHLFFQGHDTLSDWCQFVDHQKPCDIC